MTRLETPAPFGKYELLEQIGTGGMAEVFLARTFGIAGFEKRLVIKRIRPEHAGDPRFVSLFIHEAKIGVHLNHPNIVAVYELGKVGDSHYISMEHLHGRDLNKLARRWRGADPGLDPGLAVGIIAEVCRGLGYAHGDASGTGMSLVHRDVSPHNIFLTFTGEVKLVDFGIARLLSGDRSRTEPEQRRDRPAGGKYAYMSPEQALGLSVDHRTDIFSAGVVLWELIAGRKLHPGGDASAKLERVKDPDIPRPDGIDDALWGVLRRALAPDPGDRYPDAASFEEDLRAWLYDTHKRADTATLVSLMQRTFPEDYELDPAAPDLERLAEDLERLDAGDATGWSTTTPEVSQPPQNETDPVPALMPASEERRRVVAMVVDVDGFTDISLHAEPEVLFRRHLQLLRWLRGVVDAHGGTVQRAHDDQVYVFFGMARTRRDDLARGLECAEDLQRRITELHDEGVPVHLAIGVHTGDVTVSSSDARRYMARGNTTRLARRLSEQADHAQVLVSEEVHRSADPAFEWDRGPWLLGRGGKSPLPSYRLAGRRVGTLPAPRSPWFKRGGELDTLREALLSVRDSHGATVVLAGEEGSGKTRLTRELHTIASRNRIPMYVGRAGPFGHRLKLLAEVVSDILDLSGTADVAAEMERLRPLGLFPRDLAVLTALIDGGDRTMDSLEAWSAVTRALRGLATDGAVVLVFEDVHHLDARELPNFLRMVQRLQSCSALTILTWTGREAPAIPGARQVQLEAFSGGLQHRLVGALLGASRIAPNLAELVSETCEGNPLYIEELVRYLHAEGLVTVQGETARLTTADRPALPDNIAGLIAARIDDLDPASKGALQIAAAIGPEFELSLLGDVIGLEDPFALVSDLASNGLVQPTDHGDRWTFASDYVRDAARRGILGVQRRDHHRLIAAAMERGPPQDRAEWYESLATHCGKGERYIDAARFTYAAGQRHEGEQALDRARRCYQSGMRWLDRAETTPDTFDARIQGEAMLRLRLGAVQLLLGDIAAGLAELRFALEITADARLTWLEARAHLQLARHHLQDGNALIASAHLKEARSLAHREEDRLLEVEVLAATAHHELAEGHTANSLRTWSTALEFAGDDPTLRARCLNGIANCHLRSGSLEAAQPALESALDAARAAEDRLLEGRIVNNIGLVYAWQHMGDEAIDQFRRALKLRAGLGYSRGAAVNHHNIGDVHLGRGELAKAYVAFKRSREIAEEMSWERGIAMNDVYLGWIDAVQHGSAEGARRIDDAMAAARRLGDHEIVLTGKWLHGKLCLHRGESEDGLRHLEAARDRAHDLGFGSLAREIEQSMPT